MRIWAVRAFNSRGVYLGRVISIDSYYRNKNGAAADCLIQGIDEQFMAWVNLADIVIGD
jgi:hypothetical protein